MDEGNCEPGDFKKTPCFGKNCAEGMYSSLSCSKDCKWVKPKNCMGCKPGVTIRKQNCIKGNPQCGQIRIEETCKLIAPQKICGGNVDLPIGQLSVRYLDRCPYNLCVPGRSITTSCKTSSGAYGTQKKKCTKDCKWGEPTPCDPGGTTCPKSMQCKAGEVTTSKKSCGKNMCGKTYTEKKTCSASGCGFSTTTTRASECPECAAGSTRKVYCKTNQGACGYLTVKCDKNCEWESNPPSGQKTDECVANKNSCVPGTTKTDYVSCGADTCGRKYPRKMKCMSTGCGFQFVSEDKSVCPSCKPGQSEVTKTLCKPGFPSCGYIQRKCNASTCDWQTLPCPVCG
jgi:hypothetical protein